MSHSVQSSEKEIRGYYTVFGSLMVLTVITVALAGLKVGVVTGVVLALIVATLKASLVVSFFMHMLHETKTVCVLSILTVFFFLSLIGLIVVSNYSVPEGTKFLNLDPKYATVDNITVILNIPTKNGYSYHKNKRRSPLTLRGIHIIFVVAVTLLCFFMAFWAFSQYKDSNSSVYLMSALGSIFTSLAANCLWCSLFAKGKS